MEHSESIDGDGAASTGWRLPALAIKALTLCVFVLATTACATSGNLVSPKSAPRASEGHIAGQFVSERKGLTTAFIATNMDTKAEYVLPFTADSLFEAGRYETVVIAVPPGRYRLSHWIVFNSLFGTTSLNREFTSPMKESLLSEPFQVIAGRVVFIGKFSGHNLWQPGLTRSTTTGSWRRQPFSREDARKAVLERFPALAAHPVSCIACDASVER